MTSSRETGHRRWPAIVAAIAVLAIAVAVLSLAIRSRRDVEPHDPVEEWSQLAGDRPLERLNVVLVTIDTLRADRLPAWGYADLRTPTIDRLAAEGVRFANAASTVPFTLPAHSSIMTGTYPPFHGVRENVGYFLDEKIPTLAERLDDAGYATGGFVSAFVLDSRWGIGRGFERYFDDFDFSEMEGANMGSVQRDGEETVAAALGWLDEARPPFFLWVHLFEPHDPYTPPEPYRSRYPGRPYDAEIAFADHILGELVDGLESRGRLGDTLLVLTGDHGEGLGDHDEAFHGYFVYDTTVHVPLIIRPPFSGFAGSVVEEPVSHVDLMPTILAATGRTPPQAAQGRSLLAAMLASRPGAHTDGPRAGGARTDGYQSGGARTASAPSDSDGGPDTQAEPRSDVAAYTESTYPLNHYGWAPLYALRTTRWKFVEAPRPELYDLAADPGERHNLAESDPVRVAAMRQTLAAIRDRIEYHGAERNAELDMDEETLAMLRSLGYVAAGSRRPEAAGERDDPKDKIHLHRLIMLAQSDVAAGDEEAAEQKLTRLIADDPGIVDAQQMLGNIYSQRGEHERAIEHFQAALELDDTHRASLFGLAEAYRQSGRLDEAMVGFRRLLELNPHDVKASLEVSRIHVDRGDLRDALRVVEEAMRQDKPPAILHNQRGELLALQGRSAEAIRDFERAAELRDDFAQPRFNLGVLFEEQGNAQRALRAYQEALEIAPRHYQAQFNLGRLYGALGDLDRQQQLYEDAIESNPNFVLGHWVLAKLIMDRGGDLARAEELTRRGIERDPEHAEGPLGYFLLADILNRRGRRAEAQQALRTARSIQGSSG